MVMRSECRGMNAPKTEKTNLDEFRLQLPFFPHQPAPQHKLGQTLPKTYNAMSHFSLGKPTFELWRVVGANSSWLLRFKFTSNCRERFTKYVSLGVQKSFKM